MEKPFYKRRKKGVCDKNPEDIGTLLQMVLDKYHITEDITLKTLRDEFENIVGPLVLPHVKLERFDKGILTLKCSNSTWKHELFLQKKAIIDKCNLILGTPSIKNILFI